MGCNPVFRNSWLLTTMEASLACPWEGWRSRGALVMPNHALVFSFWIYDQRILPLLLVCHFLFFPIEEFFFPFHFSSFLLCFSLIPVCHATHGPLGPKG